MIRFFIKKAFFDGWDNLFGLVAFNAVHLAILLCFIALPLSLGVSEPLSFLFTSLGILALSVWQSLCAFSMNDLSDYKSLGFKSSLAYFRKALAPGLQMGLINLVLWFSVTIGIPFYLMQKGFLGTFAASLLFWTCLIAILVSQYYLPLVARLGGGFKKNMRKAFILALDNPGFSLFLCASSILTVIISVLTAFLAPGLTGLALSSADAVKLRLKKYDWLEQNPGADKKHVPWDELLEEEKEMVGVRTLKGTIFPWKEGK